MHWPNSIELWTEGHWEGKSQALAKLICYFAYFTFYKYLKTFVGTMGCAHVVKVGRNIKGRRPNNQWTNSCCGFFILLNTADTLSNWIAYRGFSLQRIYRRYWPLLSCLFYVKRPSNCKDIKHVPTRKMNTWYFSLSLGEYWILKKHLVSSFKLSERHQSWIHSKLY